VIGRRNPRRNIVLSGFHCCQAEQTGSALARRLKRQLVSVDGEMARRERLSVQRLIGLGKPPQPGKLEEWVIRDITYRENLVVVMDHPPQSNGHSYAELREHSYTVFLDTPFAVLWERIEREPGLGDMVLERERRGVYDLWLAGREHFEQCDLQLSSAGDPSQLSKLIAHCFFT